MQFRKANGRQMQRFGRTAQTLLALALLCERLNAAAPTVRFLVLCLIRMAEVIARDHVFGIAYDAGMQPSQEIASLFDMDGGPPDGPLLACRFQALALILGYLMQHDLIVLATHECELRPFDVRSAPSGFRSMIADIFRSSNINVPIHDTS